MKHGLGIYLSASALLGAPSAIAAPPPAFAPCSVCHTTVKSKAPGLGPNLFGVMGRKAGSTTFRYSAPMKASAIVWNAKDIDSFIAAPRKRVPNTSMAFAGVSDPKKRQEIIAFLATLK